MLVVEICFLPTRFYWDTSKKYVCVLLMTRARGANLKRSSWLAGKARTLRDIKHERNGNIDLHGYSRLSRGAIVDDGILIVASPSAHMQDTAAPKHETTMGNTRSTTPLKERVSTARLGHIGAKIDATTKRLVEERPRPKASLYSHS